MADQKSNPGITPDRGNQNPGQGDRNRDFDKEGGKTGTGTERERGTVQEPGTQPERDRQGDGSSQNNPGDKGRTGM